MEPGTIQENQPDSPVTPPPETTGPAIKDFEPLPPKKSRKLTADSPTWGERKAASEKRRIADRKKREERTAKWPPRKYKPLTAMQKKMARGLQAGKGVVQAYVDAGGSPTGYNASKMKQRIMEKIPDIMDRVGLTEERLVRRLKDKLKASDTKFFAKDGIVTDQRNVDDNLTQMKALDMAFNLRGSYAARPGTRVEVAGDGEIEVVIRSVE